MSEGTVRVTRATAFIDDAAADSRCDYYAEHDSVCASIGGGSIAIHGKADDVYLTLVKAAEAVRTHITEDLARHLLHITEDLARHLLFGWPDDVDGATEVPADEQALRDEYAANPPRIVQSWCPHAGHLSDHERLDDGSLRCLECGGVKPATTKVPA